jgi:hypothetical protein
MQWCVGVEPPPAAMHVAAEVAVLAGWLGSGTHHDVQMQPVRSQVHHALALRRQACKVGREHRGANHRIAHGRQRQTRGHGGWVPKPKRIMRYGEIYLWRSEEERGKPEGLRGFGLLSAWSLCRIPAFLLSIAMSPEEAEPMTQAEQMEASPAPSANPTASAGAYENTAEAEAEEEKDEEEEGALRAHDGLPASERERNM